MQGTLIICLFFFFTYRTKEGNSQCSVLIYSCDTRKTMCWDEGLRPSWINKPEHWHSILCILHTVLAQWNSGEISARFTDITGRICSPLDIHCVGRYQRLNSSTMLLLENLTWSHLWNSPSRGCRPFDAWLSYLRKVHHHHISRKLAKINHECAKVEVYCNQIDSIFQ